jgi:hypothetical protein
MSIGFMIATVVFALLLGVLLSKFYLTDRRRMTSQTMARVVSAREKVVVDATARRTQTEVVARFMANGHEHEVRRVFQGERARQFPPGRQIPVRYNPGEPWMAEVIS